MKFTEWLDTELAALDALDQAERDGKPPGPIEFTKADGSTFSEFVQFAKDNGNGSRSTMICNAGGLALLEAESTADVGQLAAAVNETVGAVNELSKRVDVLTADRADCVEVSPADLARLFSEAVDEAAQ